MIVEDSSLTSVNSCFHPILFFCVVQANTWMTSLPSPGVLPLSLHLPLSFLEFVSRNKGSFYPWSFFFFPLTLRILVTHFTVPFYGFLQVLWLISRYLLMCCFGCATFNIITGFQFLVNKKWTPSSQQLLFIEPLQQDIFHTWLNPTKKLSLFLIHKWKMEAERVEEAWPVVLGKWQSWGVSLSLLCCNTYHSHLYWSV